MKKILDYYIIKKFLLIFSLTIFSFITISTLVNIIDHLDKFIDRNLSSEEILSYYILTLPHIISITLPMSLLVSTIFTFGQLQKNNELTAIKASGVSIHRTSLPLLLIGLLFCIFSFYFDNTILVSSLNKRYEIDKKLKPYKKKFSKNRKSDIYYHLNNEFLEIRNFNYTNNTGYKTSIQKYNNNDLIKRIDSKSMQWNKIEQKWNLKNSIVRTWKDGKMYFYNIQDTSISINGISPAIIKKDYVKPEEMDYWELSNFVETLREKGQNYSKWLVNKHYKTAFACIPFIMILFGIGLSIKKPRSGYALGMGLGLSVIFLYYVLIKFGQSLGYNNVISPFISVWFVNFIFLFLGGILFIRART